ncbi:MAG: hypothetical protein N4R59_04835 [Lactobacillus iners]|nr:hypothetical protein [Lactobacillus iners]
MNAQTMNQMQPGMQTPTSSRGITRYHLTFFNILKVEIIKLLCAQFTWWCTALFILIPFALTSFFSFIVNAFTIDINRGAGISLSPVISEAYRPSCSMRVRKVEGFWRYYSNCNMDQYINVLKNTISGVYIIISLSAVIISIAFAAIAASRDREKEILSGLAVAVPKRDSLMFAKLVAVVLYVFVIQIISMIPVSVISAITLSRYYITSRLGSQSPFNTSITIVFLSAICMALFAIIGYGFGLIFKSSRIITPVFIIPQALIQMLISIQLTTYIVTLIQGRWSEPFLNPYATQSPLHEPIIKTIINLIGMIPLNAASNFISAVALHTTESNIYIPNAGLSFASLLAWAVILYGIGHTIERMRNIVK